MRMYLKNYVILARDSCGVYDSCLYIKHSVKTPIEITWPPEYTFPSCAVPGWVVTEWALLLCIHTRVRLVYLLQRQHQTESVGHLKLPGARVFALYQYLYDNLHSIFKICMPFFIDFDDDFQIMFWTWTKNFPMSRSHLGIMQTGVINRGCPHRQLNAPKQTMWKKTYKDPHLAMQCTPDISRSIVY